MDTPETIEGQITQLRARQAELLRLAAVPSKTAHERYLAGLNADAEAKSRAVSESLERALAGTKALNQAESEAYRHQIAAIAAVVPPAADMLCPLCGAPSSFDPWPPVIFSGYPNVTLLCGNRQHRWTIKWPECPFQLPEKGTME